MKRLIFWFVLSFLSLFLIWVTIAWLKYPDSFYEKHIDMYSIITNLSEAEVISVSEFYNDLNEIKNNAEISEGIFDDILSGIVLFLSPFIYIIRLFVELIEFILIIFEFIFNPVFY